MDKLILEVYARNSSQGTQVAFKWPLGVRENLEKYELMESLGDCLAQFGEQLKLQAMGIAKVGPGTIYGPDGNPVA